jgi:hypothetical protein
MIMFIIVAQTLTREQVEYKLSAAVTIMNYLLFFAH